ncbi:MAG: glutaconyl-CoA decarboxylase subunit gamma [Kofleriaceae bacterium]|nr:MAG: glutaconyl-CoA decarboxylase subunit gamma [Kofleriaceae bacterium]
MKKMMTILALASALALVGCKKKEEKTEGAGTATAGKVDDKGTAAATGTEPGTAAPTGTDTAAAGSTGSPECDEYLKTFDDVVAKCKDKMGPALDAMKQSRDAQAQAFQQWATLDEASKKAAVEAAATGCKSATDALKQSATSMGCTL